MTLFLNRILKVRVRNPYHKSLIRPTLTCFAISNIGLCLQAHRDNANARLFSSLPESPYLLLGGKKLRDSPEGQVGKHMFFDLTKEEKVYSSEKTVLMYSKRDKTFYFTSFKGLYMGSLDISNKELKFKDLRLRNQPNISEVWWEMLDKCFMSNHLVESPSGELFFIKWYTLCIRREDGECIMMHSVTKRFMVFRQDEKSKEFCCTDDIGDLCIFLGQSEAFCLSASMYPGLKPNSIYYIGSGLGSYSLASGTVHSFDPPRGKPLQVPYPCWLHPTNHI